MATRILAVLNQKGGVGKTTTCVNLGAALARRGLRVLLVDMDPQANLTVHLGLEPPRLQHTTYSLLIGQHGLAEAVHETGVPGLLVVPSTLALANAEIQLASTVGRELVLREALEAWLDPTTDNGGLPFANDDPAAAAGADFVLIDCPPSLGTLTMNALCAATEVLLPIQTEFFALQGVAGILESIRAVQRLNKSLRLSLVVPSLVDRRTTLARDVIAEVRSYFGDAVTRTEIRKNVKLAEAPSHGKTIFEWEPRSNGAADYEALAAEVLGEPLPDEEGSGDEESASAEEGGAPAAEDADVSEADDDRSESAAAEAAPAPSDEVPTLEPEPEPAPAEIAPVEMGVAESPAVETANEPETVPAPAEPPRSSGISLSPSLEAERAAAHDGRDTADDDAPAPPGDDDAPPPTLLDDEVVAPPPPAVIDRLASAPASPAPREPAASDADETASAPQRTEEDRASWWRALRRSTFGS